MKIRFLLIAVAAAVLAIGATACGDDGGDTLTLEEFLMEVEDLDTTYDERGDEIEAQFDEDIDNVTTVDEALDVGRQFFDDLLETLEDFIDGIDALNAPEEAQELQDTAVSAGRAAIDGFSDLIDEVNEAETEEDFADLVTGSNLESIFEEFGDVCEEAQAVADDNDIDVDFGCGEE